MAKNIRRRASAKMTIPLAVVAGFVPIVKGVWDRRTSTSEMTRYLTVSTTGYDPVAKRWTAQYLGEGTGSILGGMAIHWAANKLGINRMLGRARIPLIRI